MSMITKARPAVKPAPRPIVPESHTPADEAWWAANSPTIDCLFYVEGTTDPGDACNWSMPADDFFHEEMVSDPSLSDDHNGAFGMGDLREGGDR